METRAKFRYFSFYDVPRSVLFTYRGHVILLRSDFDESLDDYPDAYQVFRSEDRQIAASADWESVVSADWTHLGSVRVNDVYFDSTKREYIDCSFLLKFLN